MYTAIECPSFGPIDGLHLIERESPDLRPGTVRIAVSACGVNFVDGLIVEGRYQIKPPVPFVPGMEVETMSYYRIGGRNAEKLLAIVVAGTSRPSSLMTSSATGVVKTSRE